MLRSMTARLALEEFEQRNEHTRRLRDHFEAEV
jgi:hypothetical protein